MKRLEIATVLAKPHKVSIFDEPEAGIDLWSFSMLIKRFEEIHKEKKESLILISHQERIIRMADKIMVIEDGEVKQYGSREEVLPTLFTQEGCGKCAKNCPVGAITGVRKECYHIDPNICIKCGACKDNCAFDAVYIEA